jgi:hypothetical protein
MSQGWLDKDKVDMVLVMADIREAVEDTVELVCG